MREGGDTHRGGYCAQRGTIERGRPVQRREKGKGVNYPQRGILHTKGDDRERETCTQKREGGGGTTPRGGSCTQRGTIERGRPVHRREKGGGGDYPQILNTKGDDRDLHTNEGGGLPTKGEPAHKGGRGRPAQSGGKGRGGPAQIARETYTQRERDACTHTHKKKKSRRTCIKERIAYRQKTREGGGGGGGG